jgi:hypothetical protein
LKSLVELAASLGSAAPYLLPRLIDDLAQPFALHAVDEVRTITRARLAFLLHDPAQCVAALRPLEPHVPWERDILDERVTCYRSANDAVGVRAAEADLRLFLESSPKTFRGGSAP